MPKTAGTDESKMGGKGTGFRHKERDLSSIIAACATGFLKKNANCLWCRSGVITNQPDPPFAAAFSRPVTGQFQPGCCLSDVPGCSSPGSHRSPLRAR